MKLVTFHYYKSHNEILVNCDSISFVNPSDTFEGATEVGLIGTNKYLILQENYEEVKRRIQE